VELAVGAVVWLAVTGLLLERMGSALPRMVTKRLGLQRAAVR
jgi:hypothetical protein